VHEDETYQWRGHNDKTRDDLMEFIKSAARGLTFERAYRIERIQVLKAFRAFLSDAPIELKSIGATRSVDHWINGQLFRIDVSSYTRDVELKRRLKTEACGISSHCSTSGFILPRPSSNRCRSRCVMPANSTLEATWIWRRVARGDFTQSSTLRSPQRG